MDDRDDISVVMIGILLVLSVVVFSLIVLGFADIFIGVL